MLVLTGLLVFAFANLGSTTQASSASRPLPILRIHPISPPPNVQFIRHFPNHHQETEENAFVSSKKGVSNFILDEESNNGWNPTSLLLFDTNSEPDDDNLDDAIIWELGVENGFKKEPSESGIFKGHVKKYEDVLPLDDNNHRGRQHSISRTYPV